VGGGYGGFAAARALDAFCAVTLVEPRDAFVHNTASLRALVEPAWLSRIFLPYDRLLRNGRVVHDRAVEVDVGRVVLGSGEELRPDFVVLASGSRYPFPAKPDGDEARVTIAQYRDLHASLAGANHVLILGAGPVGIELAGEISSRWPDKTITILEQQSEILPGPYKVELREELLRQLAARKVQLRLRETLAAQAPTPPATAAPFSARTTKGDSIDADIWFSCFGVAPVSDYLVGELAAARRSDDSITVTPELRVHGHTTVFAVGDVAAVDQNTAVRARLQGELVGRNIGAAVAGGELESYEPLPPLLLVPLGPAGGAAQLPGRDEILGPAATAELKGSHMLIEQYREHFRLQGEQP
jgi:NADH dehydrogenase FAD-containing subunit